MINKRRQDKRAESGKTKNKASEEEKPPKEDWIGVIHSINRITQKKVDIKIPLESKNDKQDSKRGEGIRRYI